MSIIELPSTTDDPILDALSPADMIRYSRTCKTVYSTVQSYMRRTFSVDKLLSRYFEPPEIYQFHVMQKATGSLISGSTAVQLFDRVIYPESDLDLYVEFQHICGAVGWLLDIGYTYVPQFKSEISPTLIETLVAFQSLQPNSPQIPENPPLDEFFPQWGMEFESYGRSVAVLNFEKQSPYRKIQVITTFQPPLRTILSFHSTCVMNIITHDTAYSLFPWTTFEERRALICTDSNTSRDNARLKYTARGWTFIDLTDLLLQKKDEPFSSFAFAAESSPSDRFGEPCVKYSSTRYVGDRWCWKIPISPVLNLPTGYIESNSWTMHFGNAYYPKLDCKLLVSGTLRFCYLTCGHEDLQKIISDHMGPCAWDTPWEPTKDDYTLLSLIKEYRRQQPRQRGLMTENTTP